MPRATNTGLTPLWFAGRRLADGRVTYTLIRHTFSRFPFYFEVLGSLSLLLLLLLSSSH